MASFFDVLADSDDEGPVTKSAAPAPAPAKGGSKRAPVGGAKATGGKGRSTGFTKAQNEGAVERPRRSDRGRDGGRGGKDTRGPRRTGGGGGGGGGGRGREFDRRSGTGRGYAEPRGASRAHADLAAALDADKAPVETLDANGEPVLAAEPEEKRVSLDEYLKQVTAEKTTGELAGELAPRDAEAEAVSGKAHKKETAAGVDLLAGVLGAGVASKGGKKSGGKVKATVDVGLLKFKSQQEEYRPARHFDDDRKGGFGDRKGGFGGRASGPRDGPREGGRGGGRGGPRDGPRDGPREGGRGRGGPRGPRSGPKPAGGKPAGGRQQRAPKAADFPTLGGK